MTTGTPLTVITSAAAQIEAQMAAIIKRMDDHYKRLSAAPRNEQVVAFRLTYLEMGIIRGSLSASIDRLRATYTVPASESIHAPPIKYTLDELEKGK